MNTEDFQIKRALDMYFRQQLELQEQIVKQLAAVERKQQVLLAIFGAAAKELRE